jgi:ubiquinone/menaquinone biosynthesis C-methylase UbiE
MTQPLTDSHEKWLFLSDNPVRRLIRPPKEFISHYLSLGMTAADLGCGPGYFTIPMAQMVGPEGKIYAIDSDERSIKAVKSRAAKHGHQNIEARVASAAQLTFIQDKSVDFILGDGLLCCMAEPEAGIKEIQRILKPGAQAYLGITRWTKKNNPKSITGERWEEILNGFQVMKRGKNLTMRWAVVTTN